MKKSNLMPSIVLGSICLVVALLLSVVNMFTAPEIAKNQEKKANAAFAEVLPGASNKQELTIDDNYPAVVDKGYKFDNGYVFQMTVAGYKPGLTIMCGVDNDGKITGAKHIASSETYGFESELNGAYTGNSLDSLNVVIATGASNNSKTSKAYYEAMKAALQSFVIANGGSVDTRSPEQIIQDNCNEALGTEDKTFIRWFKSYSLLGDAAVYVSEAGAVVCVNDTFFASALTDATPSENLTEDMINAVNNAFDVYSSTTKVDLSSYEGIGQTIQHVYKTSDDEYMFLLSTKGFEYASEPIVIEIMIDADGKIASCVTISHGESGGYGAVCGTPEYYEQYNGKDSSNYNDVDAIAESTQTSNGYKKAVREAFSAFNKFTAEGGNNQ